MYLNMDPLANNIKTVTPTPKPSRPEYTRTDSQLSETSQVSYPDEKSVAASSQASTGSKVSTLSKVGKPLKKLFSLKKKKDENKKFQRSVSQDPEEEAAKGKSATELHDELQRIREVQAFPTYYPWF